MENTSFSCSLLSISISILMMIIASIRSDLIGHWSAAPASSNNRSAAPFAEESATIERNEKEEGVEKGERSPIAIPREPPNHRALSPARKTKMKKSGGQDKSGRERTRRPPGHESIHQNCPARPKRSRKLPIAGGRGQPENSNSVKFGELGRTPLSVRSAAFPPLKPQWEKERSPWQSRSRPLARSRSNAKCRRRRESRQRDRFVQKPGMPPPVLAFRPLEPPKSRQ
jgi:hypothetical protein